jgi:phage regulator Rha-like protein
MSKNIIIIENDDLLVGTWDLAEGFGVEHRAITRLIEKYKTEFEELGFVTTRLQQIDPTKRGRRVQEYRLNEPQSVYLTTLLTNNQIVRKFKMFLTKEFFRQRKLLSKLLAQRQNQEWLEKRENGKIERRLETDKIQEFIAYAKAQGSESADKYYMIISKMENTALFSLELLEQKFPNLRDVVSGFALDSLKMADRIVGRALTEGMEKNFHYKDIYKLAKVRVETFADSIGKTPVIQFVKTKEKIGTVQNEGRNCTI